MIEVALQKYPASFAVDDGLEITVRPLEESDEAAFGAFFTAIPEEERSFIKHRITDGVLFHEWCQQIDYQSNLPLLAVVGDQIVADATLHQRQGGWKRHIGLVSTLTHPDFRNKGIVDVIIDEMVEIGRHAGLLRLEAEFIGQREGSMDALAKAGFSELVRLPKYVQDMQQAYHDYVLMGMNLAPNQDLLSAGD